VTILLTWARVQLWSGKGKSRLAKAALHPWLVERILARATDRSAGEPALKDTRRILLLFCQSIEIESVSIEQIALLFFLLLLVASPFSIYMASRARLLTRCAELAGSQYSLQALMTRLLMVPPANQCMSSRCCQTTTIVAKPPPLLSS
jgi:hypothetical protein